MTIGVRKIAGIAIAACIAATVTATGLTSASAAPSACTDISSLRGTALRSCLSVLQAQAETAGHTAAVADEAYLKAKAATSTAQKQAEKLNSAAATAAVVAAASRTRAAVVAAHLARSGGSVGQTTEVLLSGEGATKVLYHLSRMDELTEDTTQLANDAARDSDAAEDLQQQAALAADRLATQEQQAKDAYHAAKKTAAAVALLVQQAQIKQSGGSKADLRAFVDLPADASIAAKAVAFARAQIGDPYVFGAAGPGSWDCSGLTMGAYAAAGIAIGGHGVNVQYAKARSRGLLVPYSQVQPGDLLFYGSGDLYHVAIYSGGGNMIEAPYPGRSVREVAVRTGDLASLVARFSG